LPSLGPGQGLRERCVTDGIPFRSTSRRANVTGEPLVRPVWSEFDDEAFAGVDDRVMIDPALFAAPFLYKDVDVMRLVLPRGSRWFAYATLHEVSGELEVRSGAMPMLVRGESIIPDGKRVRKSVAFMVHDPISLRICVNERGEASGELYLDDGVSFDSTKGQFSHREFELHGSVLKNVGCGESDVVVEDVEVVGLSERVVAVTCGARVLDFEAETPGCVLRIRNPNLGVSEDWGITIS